MTNSDSHYFQSEEHTDKPVHFIVDGREVSTDAERREVIRCRFGEWPLPDIESDYAQDFQTYVLSTATPERNAALAEARKRLGQEAAEAPTTLRSLRLLRGLSQKELADLIETSQPQIARLEANTHDPNLKTLRKLAAVLEVDLNKLGAVFDD